MKDISKIILVGVSTLIAIEQIKNVRDKKSEPEITKLYNEWLIDVKKFLDKK